MVTNSVNYKNINEKGLHFLLRKFHRNIKFVHVENTSCHKSNDGWLKTWKKITNTKTQVVNCSFAGCNKAASLGSHIRYSGSSIRYASWYIVPACSLCNSKYAQGTYLKHNTLLLKVVDGGNLFRRPTLLLGNLKADKADVYIEKNKNGLGYHKSIIDYHHLWNKRQKITIRRWPIRKGLLVKWGWKK